MPTVVVSMRYAGLHAAYFKTYKAASINAPTAFVHNHLTALLLPIPDSFYIVDFEQADVMCVWTKPRTEGGVEYVAGIRRRIKALQKNATLLAAFDLTHFQEVSSAHLPPTHVPGVPDDPVLGKKRRLSSGQYQSALSYPAAKKAKREHARDPDEVENERPGATPCRTGSEAGKQAESGRGHVPLTPIANATSDNSGPIPVKNEPVDGPTLPLSSKATQTVKAPRGVPSTTGAGAPLDKFMNAVNHSAALAVKNTTLLRAIVKAELANKRLRAEVRRGMQGPGEEARVVA